MWDKFIDLLTGGKWSRMKTDLIFKDALIDLYKATNDDLVEEVNRLRNTIKNQDQELDDMYEKMEDLEQQLNRSAF